MNKSFLAFIICLITSAFAYSQPCNINSSVVSSGLMYPPADSLPCVEQGSAYNSSIQINMPSIFHGILTLDSLFIDSIAGLPAGITWGSNPSSPFVLYGDSSGCIAFSGNTIDSSGNYPLTFYCHAAVTGQSAGTENLSYQQLSQISDAPIPYYNLNVILHGDSCHGPQTETGISLIPGALNWNLYHNPIPDGNFQLSVTNNLVGSELEMFDVAGKLI